MQDILQKILNIVWSVWRYRWLALCLAWVIALAGWVVVGSMENHYRAKARIFVDSNRVLAPLLKGVAIQPDVQQRVAMVTRAMMTRPNIERLIRETDLDHAVTSPREFEQLLQSVQQRIVLRSTRRTGSIYGVSFTHPDPEMAKRVVQTLISIFIENNLGDEREDSESTKRFLDGQIADYHERLSAAEERLAAFKRSNARVMPGESGDYYSRLDEASTQLRVATLELREAGERRASLAAQLSTEQPFIYEQLASTVSDEELRIQGLQASLDELLLRYTERHPRVTQLRETIVELEQERINNQNAGVRGVGQQRAQENPVYQSLKPMVAEAEARVAELRARVSDYESQIVDLEGTIDSIPKVEAELQKLDRDYITLKQQHDVLLEKRESARLSEQIESKADDVKFRVIDPPFVPSTPDSPNKMLLNVAVLVFSLGAGAGLAFLLSLLKPVFFNQRMLRVNDFEYPVFGSVSIYRSKQAQLLDRVGHGAFAAVAMCLPAILGGLLFMHSQRLTFEDLAAREEFQTIMQVRDSAVVQQVLQSGVYARLVGTLRGGA